MKLTKFIWPALIVGVLAFAYRGALLGPAPTPSALASDLTLTDALAQAEQSGKPVFAVVTMDSCPPCQSYKRNALADADVGLALEQRTLAIHLNASTDPTGANALGVRSVPATLLIKDGAVVARTTGTRSSQELLAWLDEHAPADVSAAP